MRYTAFEVVTALFVSYTIKIRKETGISKLPMAAA